ncbi:hypothetical protein SOVF_173990 [Spinacia oleracea]|nr:hypothetical protein SOVF_173990 [Spinacia oleracea]
MASRLFLFCVMIIVGAMMMSTSTLPVAAHRPLKLPNHLSEEMIPTVLIPNHELPKPTMSEFRKPKRGLLQVNIYPTLGAVPVSVGGVLPAVTGLLPVTPP